MDDVLPHVSIVIPAYNAAERIPTALNSVVGQTYSSSDLEVIVVDDGSEDDTAAVARHHLAETTMSSRVLTVENGGPSRARNIGWAAAEGDWIQFLDDDDWIEETKLETQAGVAETVSGEVAVLYSDWKRVRYGHDVEEGSATIATPRIRDEHALADLISTEGFIHLGSALFNRGWLERVDGFDEECWLIEDVHLHLRLAMAGGRFMHVETDQPVFFYRQREEGSLASGNQEAFIEGCLRNARMVERYARRHDRMDEELRAQLVRVYFQGTRYYASRDWKRFKEVWRWIRHLDESALPEHPAHLRAVARMVGYPTAEKVAISYRRLKETLQKAISLL